VRASREVLQQEGDDPVDALGLDGVVVVEDDVHPAREPGHPVKERPRERLDPRRPGRAQRGQDVLPEPLLDGT
jgi:hypothetical protein